jgi:malonyl-CoA O-methyltransferase
MESGDPPHARISTRQGYDAWSAFYDADDNPLIAVEEPVLAPLLGSLGGRSVLELACGTGRHTCTMERAGAQVVAVDFSEGMIRHAREKTSVPLLRADLRDRLPFQDCAFDAIVCALALDHVANPVALLNEAHRVARNGGFMLISVMHPAMNLLGVQARFNDPATGQKIVIESASNTISDYVNASIRAGWRIEQMSEHVVSGELADRMPRARRYVNWPILLVMTLRAGGVGRR